MSRCLWLAVLMAAIAPRGESQSFPLTVACHDANGRPVSAVQVETGVIASARIDRDGRPVIEYDARRIGGITPQQQLFVYAHECGHHALGHVRRGQVPDLTQESAADCYGIQSLIRTAGFTARDVGILQTYMQELDNDAARHLPWRTRTYHLDACLATEKSDDRTARGDRTGEVQTEDCVLHQDAANVILDKTPDGRTIAGLYTVANRCAREVMCTFTIETGTLPDADIDVGSWRNFHVQKTRNEQHGLKPAVPDPRNPSSGQPVSIETEFRFRETVDSVLAGESVDFRVITNCR